MREYNDAVISAAQIFQPELLFAFKAQYLRARTLEILRKQGVRLCNYYPDTSVFAHGSQLPRALPHYDRIFSTKPFGARDLLEGLGVTNVEYLPHGYDSSLFMPLECDASERLRYSCDVSVIATHTTAKEAVVRALIRRVPQLNIRIWGNGWERCASPEVLSRVEGFALIGTSYAKAIGAAKINLALLSGPTKGASQGDEMTTRSFEIPASGGVMVHPRTAELLKHFVEPSEVLCFHDDDELARVITRLLESPVDRHNLAAAGYARCVPEYSYERRLRRILAWHANTAVSLPYVEADL